jgi:hypothetical protein
MRCAACFVGRALLSVAVAAAMVHPASAQTARRFAVIPFEFDPANTHLVASEWEEGIGCPTNATTSDGGTYTDPACATGDQSDKHVQGLLLAKTGPTTNVAAAGATLKGVKGMVVYELGYDIRKPGLFSVPAGLSSFDDRGSHCGAGAPRFNITTEDGTTFFIGCNSPPAPSQTPGTGWVRLQWGGTVPLRAFGPNGETDISGSTVKSIDIIFDEGQDAGPDNFGMSVLDNIDVNGVRVGRGPDKPQDADRDEGHGEDRDHRHYDFHDSQSRPESSSLSFHDPVAAVSVQSLNGARSITYNGACVSFVSDAAFNSDPDHVVSFASCDLSGAPTLPGVPASIGNYTIVVSGASGIVYQKTGDLVSGGVSIHK